MSVVAQSYASVVSDQSTSVFVPPANGLASVNESVSLGEHETSVRKFNLLIYGLQKVLRDMFVLQRI